MQAEVTWDQEPAELLRRPRGGAVGRGAVPQRLLGSSPCHCVTSSKASHQNIKAAADATKGYAVQFATKIRKCYKANLSAVCRSDFHTLVDDDM